MESKQQLKQKLDQAIDEMDLDGIRETLDRLTGLEDHPIAAESPELFAARICLDIIRKLCSLPRFTAACSSGHVDYCLQIIKACGKGRHR